MRMINRGRKMMKKIKIFTVFLVVLAVFFSLNDVNAAIRSKSTSDGAYANFRNVRAGKIGENNLYRSRHPANSSKRSVVANELAFENSIQTVLNLSNSENRVKKNIRQYNYDISYYYRFLYERGSVYAVHLSVKPGGSSYRKKVGDALKFMARNKGPYLVHCEVGRDRTGFVIMLLESLMGAPYSYMLDDCTQSFVNVDKLSDVDAKNKAVRKLNNELSYITGMDKTTDWGKVYLPQYTEIFLMKCGMSGGDIAALKRNLSESFEPIGVLYNSTDNSTAP